MPRSSRTSSRTLRLVLFLGTRSPDILSTTTSSSLSALTHSCTSRLESALEVARRCSKSRSTTLSLHSSSPRFKSLSLSLSLSSSPSLTLISTSHRHRLLSRHLRLHGSRGRSVCSRPVRPKVDAPTCLSPPASPTESPTLLRRHSPLQHGQPPSRTRSGRSRRTTPGPCSQGARSLPPARSFLITQLLWKLKLKANGEPDRHKARFVVGGHRQREGIDYNEVFAPKLGMVALRSILSNAAAHGHHIHNLDVNAAFLYADITEEVYIELPPTVTSKN